MQLTVLPLYLAVYQLLVFLLLYSFVYFTLEISVSEMSRSFKWVCGLCTYENYPAALKCVMCYQSCPSLLINEPRPPSTMAGDKSSSSQLICIPCEQTESDPVVSGSYDDVISSELELKAKISTKSEPASSQAVDRPLDDAGAAIGTSLDMCLDVKGASPKGTEISKKWTCSYCTYMNWNRSSKCVICQNGKPNPNLAQEIASSASTERGVTDDGSDITALQSSPSSISLGGACGHLSRGHTSTGTFHRHGHASISPFQVQSMHGGKRGNGSVQNEENLNIMNSHDSACSERMGQLFRGAAWMNDSPSESEHRPLSYPEKVGGRRETELGRPWKRSAKKMNWLFLKACVGILEDNIEAVDRYLSYGGNVGRSLTPDEVKLLSRPSAFDVGYTLVHLAVRFRRHNILALILTPEVAKRNLKRSPAVLCPEIADLIRHEIFNSLRMRKGDFPCQYFSEYLTFLLPAEIASLPSSIQCLLFDELLDKDVQKELEDEFAINWCADTDRLHALWNRSAGDCLLDSVLQATWGVFDRDNVLRRAMAETMQECSPYFYTRWKEWELMQASLLNFSLSERQCLQDWAFLTSLALQPGASLEHCHIFVLSHILRRPIIVYGVKYLKSFQGDTLGLAKFQGVYIPFLWDRTFCWKSPIALGYTCGHFTALVPMESDTMDVFGVMPRDARTESPPSCTYLPLMDCDKKLLPIHFTSSDQGQTDDHQECILYDWMDCQMTSTGILVAEQKLGKRPPLAARLLDQWLDHYRHLSFARLGEDSETEDEG